jgi:hypothetical protein
MNHASMIIQDLHRILLFRFINKIIIYIQWILSLIIYKEKYHSVVIKLVVKLVNFINGFQNGKYKIQIKLVEFKMDFKYNL